MSKSRCLAPPANSLPLSRQFAMSSVNSKRLSKRALFESNGRNRTFFAQSDHGARKQYDKPLKKGDLKRTERPNTFDKEWSPRFGNCWHCGGKHWHRDCTKRTKKLNHKNASTANAGNRALSTTAEVAAGDDSAALFKQPGGATIAFDASGGGRALCAQDIEFTRDASQSLHPSIRAHPCAGEANTASPTLSPLELFAQDESELHAAEMRAAERRSDSADTSDTYYDSDRPYSLWVNYYPNEDDGAFDPDRLNDSLAADNERYAQARQERARIKGILKRGHAKELKDLRIELSNNLVLAHHHAARDSHPNSYGDVIRRTAQWLTRIDER
eukprot:3902510-Pleurochrysis_carterae.AAC.2